MFTKKPDVTIQPPPGLQQQPETTTPEVIRTPQQPVLPTSETTTEVTTTPTAQTTPLQVSLQQPQVRRKLTTKTTPAKNDLLATIDTRVLHLITNEDSEEKKLSLDSMHLQEWYDDDNEDYDANELKTAIKEEHDSLQKTSVFTRVQATDYNEQQLKEVIQTKLVIRSRPRGTKRKLKARFVAKGFTQKVNIDAIYAATPAAITLRMLLTIAQLNNHSIYMSNIHSAFLNTPVQPSTTILVKRTQTTSGMRTRQQHTVETQQTT
eukprot:5109632-Amphidinium_carterae.1